MVGIGVDDLPAAWRGRDHDKRDRVPSPKNAIGWIKPES